MPLPPYLTSAASSRAHHALLVKLDESLSPQAEDAVIQEEVERCRVVLANHPRSSRVSQTLVILLHCNTMAHVPLDLEFALVPALQLAEGGKTLVERRMGYRYLCEQLPPGHELHLLLVNTIRKDLASDDEGHILAALGAIAHLPGVDLGPAVIPLLTSKRLLEHDVPEVRQRTIQAMSALQASLSLRDLARRIRHEDDPAVLASVLRAFAQALDGGREEDPTRRRRQFDSVFAAAERRIESGSALLTQIIHVLVAIVRSLPRDLALDDLSPHVLERARSLLELIAHRITGKGRPHWAVGDLAVLGEFGAVPPCLLETCALVSALYDTGGAGSGGDVLLAHIRHLLNTKGKGRAQDPTPLDYPNAHVTVIKCLRWLPLQLWQEGLEESHMAAIMGGLQSADATVRRETLRLLCVVDRGIVSEALRVLLESISSSGNAERALEVVQVDAEGLPPAERGRKLVTGTARIAKALGEEVWILGVQALLGDLHSASSELRTSFINTLAGEVDGNATLAVLLASAATEERTVGEKVVNALLDALPAVPSSVQEIIVIALVPLTAGGSAQHAVEVLNAVKMSADKHIAKRCEEVRIVLESGKAAQVVSRAKSRSLGDVLDVILAVNAELRRPSENPSPSPSFSRLGQSELRYGYDEAKSPSRRSLAMGRSMLVENEEV